MAGRIRWLAVVAAGAAGAAGTRVLAARRNRESLPVRHADGYDTERAVTVDRPMEQVAELWRDPARLSVVLNRPVSVERLDEHQWRYVVRESADGGWTVEATAEERDGRLQWRIAQGPMTHEGQLRLVAAPADRGTEIRAELSYPGGRLRHSAAVLRGHDPDQVLRTTLRRVKSVLECGQVVSTMHEPAARGGTAEGLTRALRGKLASGGRP